MDLSLLKVIIGIYARASTFVQIDPGRIGAAKTMRARLNGEIHED